MRPRCGLIWVPLSQRSYVHRYKLTDLQREETSLLNRLYHLLWAHQVGLQLQCFPHFNLTKRVLAPPPLHVLFAVNTHLVSCEWGTILTPCFGIHVSGPICLNHPQPTLAGSSSASRSNQFCWHMKSNFPDFLQPVEARYCLPSKDKDCMSPCILSNVLNKENKKMENWLSGI